MASGIVWLVYLWCALGNWISWKHQHPLSWPWQWLSLPSGLTSLCWGHQEGFICWRASLCNQNRCPVGFLLKWTVWLRRKRIQTCDTSWSGSLTLIFEQTLFFFPSFLFLEGVLTPLFQTRLWREYFLQVINANPHMYCWWGWLLSTFPRVVWQPLLDGPCTQFSVWGSAGKYSTPLFQEVIERMRAYRCTWSRASFPQLFIRRYSWGALRAHKAPEYWKDVGNQREFFTQLGKELGIKKVCAKLSQDERM